MVDLSKYFSTNKPSRFVNNDPNSIPQELAAGVGHPQPGAFYYPSSVDNDAVADGAISTAKIQAGAIDADRIAANAVTAAKIAAGSISAVHIEGESINAGRLAAGSVETDKLAANAVTAAKIAANTITAAQIAANTITASQIAADSITANEIAANAISASELQANSVITAKILAANVTSSRMEVDISGKTFGAQSGAVSLPGYYFGSGINYGMMLGTSIPFFGAPLYLVANGSAAFWVGGTVNGSQKLTPFTDNTYSLGDSTKRWLDVWAVDGTINTSDRTIKRDIGNTPLGLRFINRLRPVAYRWKETADTQAIAAADAAFDAEAMGRESQPWEQRIIDAQAKMMTLRGDHPDLPRLEFVVAQCQQKLNEIRSRHESPRIEAQKARRPGRRFHYGLIAQEVKEALDAEGVDAAFWKVSPDGLQSLSYSELVAPLIRAIQELTERVEQLEGAK